MKNSKIGGLIISIVLLSVLSSINSACTTTNDPADEPDPNTANDMGEISGIVEDQDGNLYHNVKMTLKEGSATFRVVSTGENGMYTFTNVPVGSYSVDIELPLSTDAVSGDSKSVSVSKSNTTNADFTIETTAIDGTLVLGSGDLLGEVRTATGDVPSSGSDLLYAVNVFTDQALVPLIGPDGMQVTLAQWDNAEGTVEIYCEGKTSHMEFTFSGLLPEGAYTLWVAPMNGSNITGTGALGDSSGSDNILDVDATGNASISIAMDSGSLSVFGSLSSCVMTSQTDVVLILDYHIDGLTHGSSPGADKDDVGHLLFFL
ncbi:MAG: carboxypeptidase-like regulatory domain-containing protein [Flavobacteriaceae bacterium]